MTACFVSGVYNAILFRTSSIVAGQLSGALVPAVLLVVFAIVTVVTILLCTWRFYRRKRSRDVRSSSPEEKEPYEPMELESVQMQGGPASATDVEAAECDYI